MLGPAGQLEVDVLERWLRDREVLQRDVLFDGPAGDAGRREDGLVGVDHDVAVVDHSVVVLADGAEGEQLTVTGSLRVRLVRSRHMPYAELNPTVRKLSPLLNDSHVATLRTLIEDFAGFDASSVNWQCEYLWVLTRHPVC